MCACQPSDELSEVGQYRPIPVSQAQAAAASGDQLSMSIDGVEWRFETEVFGAFHPPGYHQALMISGTQGPKDANEKTFNINLYGITGPGTYPLRSGNAVGSVAQIGNLSHEEFLAGNMMPFDLTVVIERAETNPTRIRATFSGSIETNTARQLQIRDGVFQYTE